MAGVDVQHNRGWSQHRRANHRNRHKPCDVRWLGILERALEDMVIGLHTLHHLAEEAGYALTPEGRWTEIEKVTKGEGAKIRHSSSRDGKGGAGDDDR